MDFDKYLDDIISNPDKVKSDELSADEILELTKKINPYAYIPKDVTGEKKKYAIASFTNLREEYLRRFTMTSMIAYLWKMLDEWDVPADVRSWIPKKTRTKDKTLNVVDIDRIIDQLETLLELAKETRESKKDDVEDLSGAALSLGMYAHMISEDLKDRIPATLEPSKMNAKVKAEFEKFPEEAKKRYVNLGSTVQMPQKNAKSILENFFSTWLQYDPLKHVKCAVEEGRPAEILPPSELEKRKNTPEEPVDGFTLAKLKEARATAMVGDDEIGQDVIKTMFANSVNYNSVSAIIRNNDLLNTVLYLAMNPEVTERLKPYLNKDVSKTLEIFPSQDTYHRWSYFTEVNYEDLRKATEALYKDRPELEWALAIWNVFEGSEEECKRKFDDYSMRYQDEVPTDIKMIQMGGWTPLGDFRENREKIEFYNKNTGVLKKILDRHLEDKKIGTELMKNRVKLGKAKNIQEDGPDRKGLKDYTECLGPNMKALGAEKGLSTEEIKRLEAAKGDLSAAKDLEYVDNIKARLAEFEEVMTTRELNITEKRDYEFYKKQLVDAIEMLDVPDEGIRVDMLINDGTSLERKTFYTKSDETLDAEHKKELELKGEDVTDIEKVTSYNYSQVRMGQAPRPDPDHYTRTIERLERQQMQREGELAPFAQALLDRAKQEEYGRAMIVERYERVGEELKPVYDVKVDGKLVEDEGVEETKEDSL